MPPFCWLCLREFGRYETYHLTLVRDGRVLPFHLFNGWNEPWRYRRFHAFRTCTACWLDHAEFHSDALEPWVWDRPQWAT